MNFTILDCYPNVLSFRLVLLASYENLTNHFICQTPLFFNWTANKPPSCVKEKEKFMDIWLICHLECTITVKPNKDQIFVTVCSLSLPFSQTHAHTQITHT